MNGAPPFVVRRTAGAVEAWSIARLPFEPRGWLVDYRAALREALAVLDAASGACLTATYTSADASPCDVENILIYNVGYGSFRHLALRRLRLLRRFAAVPPPPVALDGAAGHHHSYVLTRAPAADGPRSGEARLVASAVSIPLPQANRIERIWFEAQPRLGRQLVDGGPPAGPLHLRAVIRGSRRHVGGGSLLDMSKPLIDGLVAACSAHDGRDMPLVAERIAARLAVPPTEVTGRLLPEMPAPLGRRRLLWPYRTFVQWNPADDRLVDVDLAGEEGATDSVDLWLASPS